MTITSRLFVSGIEYTDVRSLEVEKTISQNNSVSYFTAELDNPYGRHNDDFSVGNEVKIYAGPGVEGLEGYWTFNFSGTLVNEFMSRQNGSIISGGIAGGGNWVTGLSSLGSAFYFGSPAFFIVSGINPSNYQDLSVSFWINPTQWNLNNRIIDQQNTGPENGFTFIQNVGIGSISMQLRNGVTSTANITVPTPLGSWTHVVGTLNGLGSQALIYANGSLIGSDLTAVMSAVTGDTRINIGKRTGNTTNYFSGIVDDVRIYNRTLHNDEVIKIYNSGAGLKDMHLLTGIIDNVEFTGEENNQIINLRGRDYSSRLIDNTVEPVVYANIEIGSIVRDIIVTNTNDVGSQFINNTTTTLRKITFNQTSIYDAIQQLADLSAYTFYVDNDKQLHFELIGSIRPAINFGSSFIINAKTDSTREGMANKIWVYGDRYLAGFREIFTMANPVGSIYTLIYKPHNTRVEMGGAGSTRHGGIFELNANPPSGTILPQYLVDFDNRQIIFPSGTNFGYYLPATNGSIVIDYDRSVPIVKYGENRNSIRAFGPKTKVITNKSIKDPNEATKIVEEELTKSDPFNNIQLKMNGWFDIIPGQTANITIPNFNLTESGLAIASIKYNFNPENIHSENVIELVLDKRSIDITDKIREINQKLERLEGADKLDTDVITRLEYTTGSVLLVGSYYAVSVRRLGSEFRLWGTNNIAPIGSDTSNIMLGLLGSETTQAGSISYLLGAAGDLTNPYSVLRSGGYYG